jgi:lysophospholipase L1-like esterase
VDHRRARRLTGLGGVLAAMLTGASCGLAPAQPHDYVALGDSYASGPFIPGPVRPIGCGRSDHDYPADLAARLAVTRFVDVSCSGATIDDTTRPQDIPLGVNPPQFDALSANTDLVTVTLGGNDLGFSSILLTCIPISFADPSGSPCQRHYSPGGVDQLAAAVTALAPKVAALLAGIARRAPHATVVVVDYPRILPPARGCWPVVAIAAGDVPYLDHVEQSLNAMLGAQAAAAGARFVDAGQPIGHDVCQPESAKWVEGIIPTVPSFPVHPNAAGMTAVAGMIASALGR